MKKLGIVLPEKLLLCDTQKLASTSLVEFGNENCSLNVLSRHFGLNPRGLHNAGNDAYLTTVCMLKLLETLDQDVEPIAKKVSFKGPEVVAEHDFEDFWFED
jgi:DNA polymerase III epsilon subunit-like protein